MTDHSNALHSTFVVVRFFHFFRSRGQTFWNCNFRLHFQALNALVAFGFFSSAFGKETLSSRHKATPTKGTKKTKWAEKHNSLLSQRWAVETEAGNMGEGTSHSEKIICDLKIF